MMQTSWDALEIAEPATRETILTVAQSLVVRDGFAAFSMEEVARRSGFSRRTVYNQFNNREALYRRTIQRMVGAIEDAMQIDLPVNLPTAAGIRQFCSVVQGAMLSNDYRDLVKAIEQDGRASPWILQAFDRKVLLPLRSQITVFLLTKTVNGELPVIDLENFSLELLATIEASTGRRRGSGTVPVTLDEVVDIVVRRLSKAARDERESPPERDDQQMSS